MFDFNKPKIEITEKSEKFGRFVVEPLEKRIWYYTWQFTSENHAVLPAGSRSKPG